MSSMFLQLNKFDFSKPLEQIQSTKNSNAVFTSISMFTDKYCAKIANYYSFYVCNVIAKMIELFPKTWLEPTVQKRTQTIS